MLKLRKTAPGEPLIVSMTGLRLGNSVLFFGCHDPKAVGMLAVKPGLSGRAAAVDPDRSRVTAAASAAEAEGALLETEVAPLTDLPFEQATFDVVVAARTLANLDPASRQPAFAAALHVLKPGGRCVVIETGRSRGLAGLFPSAAPIPAADIEAVLAGAGFKGVRVLADREKMLFLEGARTK